MVANNRNSTHSMKLKVTFSLCETYTNQLITPVKKGEFVARINLFAVLAPLTTVVAMAGDYSIEIYKTPTFPTGIKTVAVLPIIYRGGLDPIWLENCILEEMKNVKTFKTLPAQEIKSSMFAQGVETIDKLFMTRYANSQKIDAYISVAILAAGKESEGSAIATSMGGMTFAGSFQMCSAGLDIRFLDPQDGKVLMKGIGFGETDWKDQKGVVSTVIQKFVKKAFEVPGFKRPE